MSQNFSEIANFLWSVADLLRGDYKQADYGKIIMPFALLRRLDCVLESTKDAVLAEYAKRKNDGVQLDIFLQRKSKQAFYNISKFNLPSLLDDPKHIRQNLIAYISDFSADARDVFERFKFSERLAELDDKNLLFMLVQKFAVIDLHPDVVPNETMGYAFEELIRRFAETSNETAGEHFTPREVIKLMVQILFAGDDDALTKSGIVRSMYDPTAGTGGMLSIGEHTMAQLNPSARLRLFGQELNDESYAICKADMLIKGQDPARIKRENTLSKDQFPNEKFDYMLSNPPFGVEWKKVQNEIKSEHEKLGFAGRFGPGLPRISDGSLLFLMHLISKMRPAKEGGSRIGIVLNGSPLFTGDAGSGESEIRRWVLENDMLEAIIALPNDLFYNTGIATYVWILDNAKTGKRKGNVQLIDATRMYGKMKKSLGSKRVEITEQQIAEIVKVYAGFKKDAIFKNEFMERPKQGTAAKDDEPARVVTKVFPSTHFGYRKVTIDRPPAADKVVKVKKGQKPYDPDLRDTEIIPLSESIDAYFKREVKPHAPDAWVNTDITDEKDNEVGKVGYEINFNRYFYVYKAPRPPHIIAEEIREMEKRFVELMKGVVT
ncbi:MAG: type I restriction-modification system subunit M [Burkholderiaceae bacterium]